MANLTANRQLKVREFPGGKEPASYQITNGTQLFTGGYVILVSGRLTQYDGGNASQILGYVEPTPRPDLTTPALKGDTTVTPPYEATVETGGHVLEKVSVAGVADITSVGSAVYLASDDNTLTLTQPGTSKPLGFVDRFYSGTTVDVRVMSYEQRRAFG